MFRLSSLVLLGIASQALAQKGPGNLDVPADAKNLPLECQDILFEAGVTNEFKASKAYSNKFHVALKLSSTAKDAQDVLTLPALAGVKPTHSYTKEYDRGFVAPLTYEQACALDKDPRVGYVSACDSVECDPDTSPVAIGPPGSAGVTNAPSINGLQGECAKIIWYTLAGLDPRTVVPGEFVAITKVWVKPQDSDAFFNKFAGKVSDREAEAHGVYAGKWTPQQVCEIEKNPMVSYIDAQEPEGMGPPPGAGGPKGKGPGKGGRS
jgi:hypothetical protein